MPEDYERISKAFRRQRTGRADLEKRYEVKSLVRALDVIEAIGSSGLDGIGISDIARAVGTTKSNAFGIVQTLCDRGFVSDSGDGPTRRYRLGASFLRLATVAASQRPLAVIARKTLMALTSATGMTSRFAVLEGGSAVALARENADSGVDVAPYLGRRELPHSTGVGKSLLSGLPDEEILRLVRASGMERRTTRTITEPGQLLEDIRLCRQRGFSVDDEEDMDGVFCVAAPVRDSLGVVIGAVSVSGLKLDRDEADIHAVGRKVRDGAIAMSMDLGFNAAAYGKPLSDC